MTARDRARPWRQRGRLAALAIVCLTGTILCLARPAGEQNPAAQVFRARTDQVLIPVVVTNGGAPVTGLAAADFQLLDNGARQAVDVLAETLPLDVTLVIDASGTAAPVKGEFTAFIKTIAGTLRDEDRIRIVTFGSDIALTVPLQPAHAPLALETTEVGIFTALNDALLYALVQPAEAGRRAVVVTITDARDNWSWLGPPRLPAVAAQSDATLYGIVAGRPALIDELNRHAAVDQSSLDSGLIDHGLDALKAAAHETGGEVYDAGASKNTIEEFTKALDDCRRSYLLAYVLHGVKPDGWHNVVVTVPKFRRYTIRARKGYGGWS